MHTYVHEIILFFCSFRIVGKRLPAMICRDCMLEFPNCLAHNWCEIMRPCRSAPSPF